MISGFALVDKPGGWTSHDVVAKLRRLYGQRRVGHAGTLDPMATGVLVVGLGSATRLLRFVQGQDKIYEATIRIGAGTLTDDAEGDVTATPGWEWDADRLSKAISDLTGDIQQVPSAVSAVKVAGVRAYSRVRAGEEVLLGARPVTIRSFALIGPPRLVGMPVPGVDVDVVIECSSGTYIRALARDLGWQLGTAAHLTALRRTANGRIGVDECLALGDEPPPVAQVERVLEGAMSVIRADSATVERLRTGRPTTLETADGTYLVVDAHGSWVSVVVVDSRSARIEVNAPVP